MLTYFFINIQKEIASRGPDNNVGLVWGIPYLTYTNNEGEVEKFTVQY